VNRTQFARQNAIQIRPAGDHDCEAIRSFVVGLSERSRYLRFFCSASPPSSTVLRGLCGAGRTTDALVAVAQGAVVGHAMAADATGPGGGQVADIGLVVADRWQGRGVGSALAGCLVARAAARGVSVLAMDVLPENRPVLALISRTWPDAAFEFAPDAVTVRVRLPRRLSRNPRHGLLPDDPPRLTRGWRSGNLEPAAVPERAAAGAR
jgi:GNAT superfamily N-acetyltransferase